MDGRGSGTRPRIEQVPRTVITISVDAIVVGGVIAGEGQDHRVGTVLLPTIAESVVYIGVSGRTVAGAGTAAVAYKVGTDQSIELIILIVPVAIRAVVGGGD